MNDIVPVGTDLTEFRWSQDQTDLIKRTIGRGQDLTDDELLLFGYVCKQSGLDPFLRQIYPVKFKDKDSDQKTLVFITGIDGYRSIAERTGIYAGRDDYLFDEGLTQFQMLEANRTIPRTATCTVYKLMSGIRNPTTSTVRWKEYFPKNQNKQFFWNAMPFNQLGKTAEGLSLRTAFPLSFKGILLDAEMHQAGIQPSYEVSEDNVELINEINMIYTEMLGYNPAQIIAHCIKIVGDSNLNRVPKEKLEVLKYQLQTLVEKSDEDVTENAEQKEK